MEITSVIPENVNDVNLQELKVYSLELAGQATEVSRRMFTVHKKLYELKVKREELLREITMEVAQEQRLVKRTADRLAPYERKAASLVRLHERFPGTDEYLQLEGEMRRLELANKHIEFQADRIKQAILAASSYGKSIPRAGLLPT